MKNSTISVLHGSFIGACIIPGISLTIVQYRPAWLEQLVLRIAGIPHIVLNSSYSSNESTGPLPYLHDSCGKSSPILVGRCQPGLRRSSADEFDDTGGSPSALINVNESLLDRQQNSSILEYLRIARGVDLDDPLVDPTNNDLTKERQAKSTLLKLLVTNKLQTSLMILRYEDTDAWVQVNRKQCFDASKACGVNTSSRSLLDLPTVRGLYQAWSERVMARKGLMGLGRNVKSVDTAKMEARNAYTILEQQLSQRGSDDSCYYLLGTSQPVMVDVILWAHLAEALCDVTLVVILADFPCLIQYFQFIHKKYFATSSSESKDGSNWQVWNKHQNSINCFQQIHLDPDDRNNNKAKLKDLKNALELMHALSAHDRDLLSLLQQGKGVRAQELVTKARRKGKELSQDPEDTENDGEPKPKETDAQKARLQQHRHDMIWLMNVSLVALAYGVFLTKVGAGDD
jgi:hypothetical protein